MTHTKETSLEGRIQRLEDIEAIKKVTAAYSTYVDRGLNGKDVDVDKLLDVFTEDATWTNAAKNINAVGRSEVVKMLNDPNGSTFVMHNFTSPIIEHEEDTARATWVLWVAVTIKDTVTEIFHKVDSEYVRTPAGWLIRSIHLHFGPMLHFGNGLDDTQLRV
jgi:SnoaL-like domain